jgi:hypothetical protein
MANELEKIKKKLRKAEYIKYSEHAKEKVMFLKRTNILERNMNFILSLQRGKI